MFNKVIASDMGRIDFVSRIKNFRPDTVCYSFISFINLTYYTYQHLIKVHFIIKYF